MLCLNGLGIWFSLRTGVLFFVRTDISGNQGSTNPLGQRKTICLSNVLNFSCHSRKTGSQNMCSVSPKYMDYFLTTSCIQIVKKVQPSCEKDPAFIKSNDTCLMYSKTYFENCFDEVSLFQSVTRVD